CQTAAFARSASCSLSPPGLRRPPLPATGVTGRNGGRRSTGLGLRRELLALAGLVVDDVPALPGAVRVVLCRRGRDAVDLDPLAADDSVVPFDAVAAHGLSVLSASAPSR